MKRILFKIFALMFMLPLISISAPPTGDYQPYIPPDISLPDVSIPNYNWTIPDLDWHIPQVDFDPSMIYVPIEIAKDKNKSYSGPKISNTHVTWYYIDGFTNSLYIRNLYDKTNKNKFFTSGMILGNSLTDGEIYYSTFGVSNFNKIYFAKADDNSSIKSIYNSKRFIAEPWYSNHNLSFIESDNSSTDLVLLKTGLGVTKKIIASGVSIQRVPNYNGKIVWHERDTNTGDYEIMYYDGKDIKMITNNKDDDKDPFIHKDMVAWQHYDGTDWEIVFWTGGSTITQITNDNFNDKNPSVYNGTIAWQHFDGNDYEIMYWDGSKTHQITYNNTDDTLPYIYNGAITWENEFSTGKTAIMYAKVDTPWIPVPTEKDSFPKYDNINSPLVKNLPEYCKPIGLGDIANKKLTLKVTTPKFEGPVDVYLALVVPEFSSEIYLFKSDLSLQPVSQGLVAWKTNVTEINETLFSNINISALPKGHYIFYLAITPASDASGNKFYIWQTTFTND